MRLRCDTRALSLGGLGVALFHCRFDLPDGPLELNLELWQVQRLRHLLAVDLRQEHRLALGIRRLLFTERLERLGVGAGGGLGRGREGVLLVGIDRVEDVGGRQDEEVVLEEELDVLAAGVCSPMGPGSVAQVEEGKIGDPVAAATAHLYQLAVRKARRRAGNYTRAGSQRVSLSASPRSTRSAASDGALRARSPACAGS